MARFSRTAFLMSQKSYQSVTIFSLFYWKNKQKWKQMYCQIERNGVYEMARNLGLEFRPNFLQSGTLRTTTTRCKNSCCLHYVYPLLVLSLLTLPLCLLIIMSDEQGFTNDLKTQLVQVTFIPFFPPKKYKPKLYINHLKLQPQPLSIHQSVFINQQLKQQLSNKFINSHQSNLVYNNSRMVEGRPKNSLVFEGNFQSGNLEYVTEQSKQYHLYIRADSNTKAHHQWYYFVVRNRSVKSVSMVVHNFTKGGMMYRRGLKPYYKSLKQGKNEYQQLAGNVVYQQEETEEGEIKYRLKFDFDFSHTFDQVEFCCQPPYTSLRLSTLLLSLPFKKIELAKTVLGNKIHALLVNEQRNSKATVVVMARQHPGESVGSWMMQGLLNQLQKIDSKIFWIIIPMVNIDGVKMGNNRTGVLGHDFNRNWNVDEESLRYHLFPELMGIIKYFKQYKKEKNKKVKMFIDLHGHSSQPNAFSYGPPLFPQSQYFLNSRLFPYMLSQANHNFKLNQCSFQITNEKKNCARSVFYNRLGFPYSYTIQSSFGIYSQRNINQLDMVRMGQDICITVNNFVGAILSRKDERLRELITGVSSLSIDAFSGAQGENSDSDYEEEPQRAEFQKKVRSMLLDPELRNKEIRRFQEEKMLGKKAARYIPTYNLHEALSVRRERVKSQRTKTQEVKPIEVESQRRGNQRRNSLCLPSINGLNMLQVPRRKSREPRLSKNLSLREVTERLLSLKHNKIGRRILILNDYPTSSM